MSNQDHERHFEELEPELVLTSNQRDILYHTEHRAAGGLYCGRDNDMDVLVEAGLMEYAGIKSFVPDPYYRITGKGREALREGRSINSGGDV